MSQSHLLCRRWTLMRSCLIAVFSFAGFGLRASAADPVALPSAPSKQESPRAPDVQVIHDLAYRDLYEDEDGSLEKNKLDLYLPRGKKDFPVIFFVHGGAWLHG